MPSLQTFAMKLGATTACALLLITTAFARADERTPRAFDIGPQSLATALSEYARQSQQEILFAPTIVADKTTQGLRGMYLPLDALKQILGDTGLMFSTTPSGAILVQPAASSSDSSRASSAPRAFNAGTADGTERKAGFWDRFRLAQNEPSSSSQTDRERVRPVGDDRVELGEIVVVGSRLGRTDKEGSQQVRIYSNEQIRRSGQGTVADFFNTLPEVSVMSIDGPTSNYANQTTVQLHGLPVGSTLVLLNGRRVQINNFGFFDLNIIPLSAVERVEVLPVGASAIYGADSLAGAVNIILKKDLDGFEASARYGSGSGTDETLASFAWGMQGERGGVSLVGSYHTKDELMGAARAVTADPEFNFFTRFGLDDSCFPGTVYSRNGGNLPGLSAPQAGIPPGLSSTATIADFTATAGQRNTCGLAKYTSALSPFDREGLLASGYYRLGDSAELFSEVLLSHQEIDSSVGTPVSFTNRTLPASNPYNPFGEGVGVSYTYPGLRSTYLRATNFIRPLVGLRGALGEKWSYELTGFTSYDHSGVDETNPNFAAISAALTSSDPATALNPFSGGAPASPAVLASFVGTPVRVQVDSRNTTAEGILRGSVFDLPAGPLKTAFGVQYDKSTLHKHGGSVSVTNTPYTLERQAYSGFAEGHVPLLAGSQVARERLALDAAVRYDHSDDFGSETTWQAAMAWRPFDSLLLRGGYATSYQAPQLQQLGGGVASFNTAGWIDPFRGNTRIGPTPQRSGSNLNLQAQTGVSRQLGIVYSSRELPGLEVSLTYWDIGIEKFIARPNTPDLISFPDLFPGAVTRAPPSAQDIQNGFLGPITSINATFTNFGDYDVSGFDFDLSYSIQTALGRFAPSISLTQVNEFTSALTPSTPPTDKVNQADGTGFAPRWKGTVALNWKRGAYSANLAGRYIGRYNDYLVNQFGLNRSYPHDLGDFWLTDVNLRYDAGAALAGRSKWLAGAYFELGAVNVFDELPQSSYIFGGYDDQQGDIRGRFVYGVLGVKW